MEAIDIFREADRIHRSLRDAYARDLAHKLDKEIMGSQYTAESAEEYLDRKIKLGTKSWEGVDVDRFLGEMRYEEE